MPPRTLAQRSLDRNSKTETGYLRSPPHRGRPSSFQHLSGPRRRDIFPSFSRLLGLRSSRHWMYAASAAAANACFNRGRTVSPSALACNPPLPRRVPRAPRVSTRTADLRHLYPLHGGTSFLNRHPELIPNPALHLQQLRPRPCMQHKKGKVRTAP